MDNLETEIYIRNQAHTIMNAINRQLKRSSYHIVQVVYIGRMQKGKEWKSLIIPKGKSEELNREKFSRGQHKGHFSDDLG